MSKQKVEKLRVVVPNNKVLDYIKTGKMTLQFLNTVTGNHHTYKFTARKTYDDAYWVAEGEDRLGAVHGGGFLAASASGMRYTFKQEEIFRKLWYLIHAGLPDIFEVSNVAGTCLRCGRELTVGESIAQGFGPECITKVAALDLRNS